MIERNEFDLVPVHCDLLREGGLLVVTRYSIAGEHARNVQPEDIARRTSRTRPNARDRAAELLEEVLDEPLDVGLAHLTALAPFNDIQDLLILLGEIEPITDEELILDRLYRFLSLLDRRLDVPDDLLGGTILRDRGHDRAVEIDLFEDPAEDVRSLSEVGLDPIGLFE